MSAPITPLDGFRIAVTSDRRSNELIEAFTRRGAEVEHVPLLKLAPLDDEAALVEQTLRMITLRPQFLVICTAYGLRRWFDTAEAAGLGPRLSEVISQCRVFVRGAKAHGAVRALGFHAEAVAADGIAASVLPHLEGQVAGATVAIQLQGDQDLGLIAGLRGMGAGSIVRIEPYRWMDSAMDPQVGKLVDGLCAAHFDAVTFTSAPSVHALLAAARHRNRTPALVRSLEERVAVATVGPVTASPLQQAGITSALVPERHRMGAMIGQLVDHLSSLGTLTRQTVYGPCTLRGRTLSIEGEQCELSPAQSEIMRCLMESNGAVVSRDELGAMLPNLTSRHVLDMSLSRLRRGLPHSDLIVTVIKRGYRLNV